LPPPMIGAQHLGPAMTRLVPGSAHHHACRDAPRHWLGVIVAGDHRSTLTCSILDTEQAGRTGVSEFHVGILHAVAKIVMLTGQPLSRR
jgi:hypothetical protein